MFFRILKLLLLLAIFIIQISFVSALPHPFFYFDFIVISIVLVLMLDSFESSLLVSLPFGILLDMHSFNFFGLHIVALLLAALGANFFLIKFFTNRSAYSFVFLVLIFTFIYEFTKDFSVSLTNFLIKGESIFFRDYLISLSYKFFFNAVLMLAIFYTVNYFSKKLKPFFIIRR